MQDKALRIVLKILLYGCLALVGCVAFAVVGLFGFLRWECRLPDEQTVRNQFQQHRPDFIRLVTLLDQHESITFVEENGIVNGGEGKAMPEFSAIMKTLGVGSIRVTENRSIEFTMWGCGSAISSDHYMGVRYVPNDAAKNPKPGWEQTVVTSLDSKKLPQENGEVATGLYVVPVQPDWFIYRFEYQE